MRAVDALRPSRIALGRPARVPAVGRRAAAIAMAATPAGTEPKVAVISGGTRGIGLGIARCLAREGYSLVLGYNSNTAAAEGAQQQLREQHGVAVEVVGGDACLAATWDALFDRVQQRFDGHVTAFVHNAGLWIGLTSVSDAQPKLDGEDSWEAAFKYYHEVSVLGFSRGLRRALACKGLRHVVAISAQGCNNSSGPHVGYEAQGQGKAGLEFLVRRNALALAAQGVNVNAIVPGCTLTDALTTLMGGEERVQRMIDATPAKRAASPEEIGELAAFLCSPRAAFLTGASIPMDGGLHLRA